MCGRFTLGREPDSLLDYFHLHGEVPTFHLSYNIAPTQVTPVVLLDREQNRVCRMMRWGLIPSWSKGPDARFNMINARAETIAEKPAYRTAFRQRRCLIPADGYFEWSVQAQAKQPYYIYKQDKGLFAFAGVWEQWQSPEQQINSFSIVTTEAKGALLRIHHRMPVIVGPEKMDDWLLASGNHLYAKLLADADCSDLAYHPVSNRINSAKNNSADLLEPI